MAQAASGWLSLNGEPGGAPVKAPTFIGDDLGGLHGALGAMAALRHRDRTGEGQHVDVALQDALLFQSNGFPMLAALGVDLPRMGSQFVVTAPANVYRCRDDYVMMGVLTDPHWRVLARADRPARARRSPRLRDEPEAGRPARGAERDGPGVGRVAQRRRGRRDPGEGAPPRVRRASLRRLRARPARARARHAAARSSSRTASAHPWSAPRRSSRARRVRVRTAAPALGAHTDAMLEELGIGAAERAGLRERGVI